MSDEEREALRWATLTFPTPAGRYVLEHGRWFVPQPRPRGLRKRADKACYRNTMNHVFDHPEHLYVEGFAVDPAMVFVAQHAWAADAEGNVVDLTYREPELHLYFGVAFDVKTYATISLESGQGSLFHDGSVPALVLQATDDEARS